jgi:signal transduction histidine kinase
VIKEDKISLHRSTKILEESQENAIIIKKKANTLNELKKFQMKGKMPIRINKYVDIQKDEFLDTVTHELRTPLLRFNMKLCAKRTK